jgi:hypothetical protein
LTDLLSRLPEIIMHWLDPNHLPQTVGNVVQFTQNPKGELDGLILDRDRQVHFPPHLGRQVAKAISVGDKVHVRGVRPRGAAVIAAVSLGKSHGVEIVDNGPDAEKHRVKPAPGRGRALKVSGAVRLPLHGPKGELWGVLLEDGTVVRLKPEEAARKAKRLTPGARFAAEGMAFENQYGRVVEIGSPHPGAARKKAAKKKKA